MLILHTRIGGRASAAVIANGLFGLFGISLGLLAMAWAILPGGIPLALALLLAVPRGIKLLRLAMASTRTRTRLQETPMKLANLLV